MFTPITDELELLQSIVTELIVLTQEERIEQTNPVMNIEYTGRVAGLYEAKMQIDETVINVQQHIDYILKNTVDGNYAEKLNILEDENRVLRDKNYFLEQESKRIQEIKDKRKSGNIIIDIDKDGNDNNEDNNNKDIEEGLDL